MTNRTTPADTKYPKPAGTRLLLLWLFGAIAIASAVLLPGPFVGR